MATRAAFLSPAHVEALNAVPIEFYGNMKIVNSWKEYLDYLSKQGVPPEVWGQRRIDLFVDLLGEMAVFLGYNFSRVEISREVCQRLTPGSRPTSRPFVKEWRNCSGVKRRSPWT